MLSTVEVIGFTVVAAAIVACAHYIFKKSVPKFGMNVKDIIALITNRNIMLGGIIYVIGLAVYLVALGSGELSFVYPAFSCTFIFIVIISALKLDEKISPRRLAGILMVVLGIVLVSGLL